MAQASEDAYFAHFVSSSWQQPELHAAVVVADEEQYACDFIQPAEQVAYAEQNARAVQQVVFLSTPAAPAAVPAEAAASQYVAADAQLIEEA